MYRVWIVLPLHTRGRGSLEAWAGSALSGRAPPPQGSWRGRRASPRMWTPPSTSRRTPTHRSWRRNVWSLGPGKKCHEDFNFTAHSINYLWWTPLDRELGPAIAGVLVINDISRQSKVRHLHHVLFTDETIPGCQVPMNIVVLFKISHSPTHLGTIDDDNSIHRHDNNNAPEVPCLITCCGLCTIQTSVFAGMTVSYRAATIKLSLKLHKNRR